MDAPPSQTRTLRRGPSAGSLGVMFAAAILLVGCSGGGSADSSTAATAAPTTDGSSGVTIDVDPVPVPLGGTAMVRVSWVGQQPRTLMFVSICRVPASTSGFEAGIECSSLSEVNPNGTPDGAGSTEIEVFRGRTPDGDAPWGCFAPGDAAPPGVEANTTCYVRVTNDVVLNNDDARDVPFTITDP